MRHSVFNEEQMMFAIAGPEIVEILRPGISKEEIRDVSIRIIQKTGLSWHRAMLNIALLTEVEFNN